MSATACETGSFAIYGGEPSRDNQVSFVAYSMLNATTAVKNEIIMPNTKNEPALPK